jgi:general secretion pathway protein G
MKQNKSAFTLIELVFVIVVIGILASIAIPKFNATRVDAQITKAKSDISAVRSAIINERQTRIIKGDSSFISSLDDGASVNVEGETIFNNGLLVYGVKTKDSDGHWMKTGDNTYTFKVDGTSCSFTYNPDDGTFKLTSTQEICKKIDE